MVRELELCKKFCFFFFPDFKLYHCELVKCFKVLAGKGSAVAVWSSKSVQAKRFCVFFFSNFKLYRGSLVKCFKALIGKRSAVAVCFVQKAFKQKKKSILHKLPPSLLGNAAAPCYNYSAPVTKWVSR